MSLFLIELDAELRWRLVAAMKDHRRNYRIDGWDRPPPSFDLLLDMLSKPGADRSGPEPTKVGACGPAQDAGVVPLLADYRTAAGMLGVSERTVGRLVAGGVFAPVAVGRRRLLRRADIEAYVERKH